MERLSHDYKNIRNFLFGFLNKEFLIFLFFLALSAIFWLMMALNETYEREITVPMSLTNVPKNVVLTTEMDSTVKVTVRDKGFTLVTYMYSRRIRPVRINFGAYANKQTGYGLVPTADIQKLVYQQLMGSSKIVSVNPDKLDFYFNFGASKTVPVRMDGSVTPGKSYYLASMRFWPDKVTVYASKKMLDSIRYVKTEPIRIVNFEDTVIREVPIARMQGVKCVPSTVRIGLYPDILTEERISVPIRAINLPEGKVLRTFPSHVSVKFIVGASMFRTVKADQFVVVVDYNEVTKQTSDKCELHLVKSPYMVRNAQLEINQVDYLVEQQ